MSLAEVLTDSTSESVASYLAQIMAYLLKFQLGHTYTLILAWVLGLGILVLMFI